MFIHWANICSADYRMQGAMPNPYPFFPFYAADWVTDTQHMSAAARGLYISLLAYQWINGSIPNKHGAMARIGGCNDSDFDMAWVEIKHKFDGADDPMKLTIKNRRLEKERERAVEVSEKRSRAGRASGRARRANAEHEDEHNGEHDPEQNRTDADTSHISHSQEEENSYPSGNSSPSESFRLDGNPDGGKNDARKNCPHEKIRALYNDICVNLPRCKKMTPGRQQSLRNRWREHPNLDWWKRYFTYVHEKCPFLNGEHQEDRTREGRKPFTADFDWLLKPANMTKVIEQRYER